MFLFLFLKEFKTLQLLENRMYSTPEQQNSPVMVYPNFSNARFYLSLIWKFWILII